MAEEYNGHNNHNNHRLNCSDIRDAIDKILHQANISYEVNIGSLENYTQAIFNDHHKTHHRIWIHRDLEWLHPNKEPLEIEHYDEDIPEHIIARYRLPQVPEMEEISKELTNLYHRLKILNSAIDVIRQDHEQMKHVLMSNYPGDRFTHMVKFFSDQYNYVRALLHETESSMIQLGITVPEIMAEIDKNYDSMELRDWIVTREHLKLLNYVLKIYDVILQRCP